MSSRSSSWLRSRIFAIAIALVAVTPSDSSLADQLAREPWSLVGAFLVLVPLAFLGLLGLFAGVESSSSGGLAVRRPTPRTPWSPSSVSQLESAFSSTWAVASPSD